MKTETTKIAALLWVVLGALNDAKVTASGGLPSGDLYAQLMSEVSINGWNAVVDTLLSNKLATQSNHFLRITQRGTEVFNKLEEAYKQRK